jgi:hypothetical protein
MGIQYASGEDILAGDRVLYWNEPGQIEFVVEAGDSDAQVNWYLQTQGPGVMILEPKFFGRVYVVEPAEDKLVFVARRSSDGNHG